MKKPIKLGIAGLGRAGYSMHLKELKGKEDMFEIFAVCDIEPDRCENMKNLYGCKTYSKIEDMAEDPEIEVIDIATRSCDHFKHAKTALDAGKTVFLEKPMTESFEQAKQLIELGTKDGQQRLFVRHNRRFEAKFMQVNKIISSGILGDVYLIRRSVSNYSPRTDWQTLSQYGGGQLLNWGPHLIDQTLRLCGGDYKRIFSVTRQTTAAGDCEDFVRAVFEGVNDRIVEIEISGGTAIPVPEYVIYGTRGAVIDNGTTFTIKYLPKMFEIPNKYASPHTPEGAVFAATPDIPFIEEERDWDSNALDHTWVFLYEAVREGKEYPIKNEEAMKVMEVISEIKKQNI